VKLKTELNRTGRGQSIAGKMEMKPRGFVTATEGRHCEQTPSRIEQNEELKNLEALLEKTSEHTRGGKKADDKKAGRAGIGNGGHGTRKEKRCRQSLRKDGESIASVHTVRPRYRSE
jgi:hypothetical protein